MSYKLVNCKHKRKLKHLYELYYLHPAELRHVRCKQAMLPDLLRKIRLEIQRLFQVDLQI